MTEPLHAVFLSYASEDVAAAARIAAALRAGGIEVWFDRSELRGGDAWDQSIRRQIKTCALFIPVISANTDARAEGYFRLEWKLAVDRSHLFTATKAFLVPVAIDDTPDDDEHVPDRFRELQWTRLPDGQTPPAFVERLQRLLAGESAAAPKAASSVTGQATHDRRPGHARRVAAAGALALALLLALGFFGLERLRAPRLGVHSESIAVLPLANESGDANQQYFSDGISEDLITALSQIPELKVIGRTSAFMFRDSKEDSRSVGTKLGVAHLLEGSVRRAGETVRVTAELIDTADGRTLWSERYDRPYKDLFALQDEITRSVVGALKPKLLTGAHATAQSDRPPSGSLEAYNAWLQANFYNHLYSEAGFRKAAEYSAQAVQIDPGYVPAWSMLAIAEVNLGEDLKGQPAQDAFARARAAANRALALGPDSAAAHRAQGALLMIDGNLPGAEAELRRALALAPNDGNSKVTCGLILQLLGEFDQALELTQQAVATDPLRADWLRHVAAILFSLNRPDEAKRAMSKVLELQPATDEDRMLLAEIEIERADAQAALAAAKQLAPGLMRDFAVAAAQQIGADRGASDAALKEMIEKHADDGPVDIADIYALRNDADQTFTWLERAWRDHSPQYVGIIADPFVLRYRTDPRFSAFCRKVGLPVPEALAGKST